MSDVTVTMTAEEAARRWLGEQALCAVSWAVLDELCSVYRKHGDKTLVFDAEKPTYLLRSEVANG
jgi:hypothetical protein